MSVKSITRFFIISSAALFFNTANSQILNELGSVHGNFQIDAAYYQKDTIIDADPGSELFRYVELPLISILAQMENFGIAVDVKALKKLEENSTVLDEKIITSMRKEIVRSPKLQKKATEALPPKEIPQVQTVAQPEVAA